MCMEDEKIARNLEARSLTVATSAFVQVIGENAKRHSLILTHNGIDLNPTYYFPLVDGVAAGRAAVVVNNSSPMYIARLDEWGSLLRQPWGAANNGGVQTFTLTETSLQADTAKDLR